MQHFGLGICKVVFDDHHFHGPVGPRHAFAVVAYRADDAGYGSAVIARAGVDVAVPGATAAGVPAVVVVDVAVVVVVDAVAGDFVVVAPEVPDEVFVVDVYAVVEDRDDDGIAVGGDTAGGDVPGRLHVVVGANDAVNLAGITQLPLVVVPGIIGPGARADEVIALPGDHCGVGPVAFAEVGFFVEVKIISNEVSMQGLAQRAVAGELRFARQPRLCIYVRAQLYDHFPLPVVQQLSVKAKGSKGKNKDE